MKYCLVVDDSAVIRKVSRRILESLDFEIGEATDGKEALLSCQERMPEGIVVDWSMPEMDGYDFIKALRRMPGGERPKVIFCATDNDVATIARAMHAGADEYIMKPFDKDIMTLKFQQAGLL